MRKLCRVLAVLPLFCLPVTTSFAQTTQAPTEQHLKTFFQKKSALAKSQSGEDYFLQLTFQQIPDKYTQRELQQAGIQLLSYQANNTYLAALPTNINVNQLSKLGIIDAQIPVAQSKMATSLRNETYPEWAVSGANDVDIAVVFNDKVAIDAIINLLETYGAEILEGQHRGSRTQVIRVAANQVEAIAQSPLVAQLDVKQEPVGILNHETRSVHKVNVAHSANLGGFNLLGEGVVVGVGDGGELGEHIDFDNRVINKANGTYSSFGNHGDHVAGIIGGGGHLNPRHAGMAPECTLITQKTSLITYNMEEYYNEMGMLLTNNSYGTSFNCTTNGSYNYSAQTLDWQLREFPEVLHVFAAGNSGGGHCEPFPAGYKTVLRYYQSAKNVLTVGNVNEDRTIVGSSSRGPVLDGRLKPEIVGVGKDVYSTGRDFDYVVKGGTSMAAPAVTGTLALMIEKYRQHNAGANPAGALLKAIACNTAEDLGNAGPDYIFGYGLINARRALETIENETFVGDEIAQGETDIFSIDVPAGTKQIRVMLYWHDKEAEIYPEKALVNNLDLELISPNGTDYLPWVLNPDPAHVADLAQRGVDDLNNIEQITLDNPAAGTYTIRVDGTEVPFGDQDFYVTYEIIQEEVIVAYPFGGESLQPASNEIIQWETDPNNTHTFKVEYSIDQGNNWLVINPAVPADQRQLHWTIPTVTSEKALVRVAKNGSAVMGQTTTYFNILSTPPTLTTQAVCEGMVQLDWENPGYEVESYEIVMYNGETMTTIGNTAEVTFLVDADMTFGELYWFSVRAKTPEGKYSERITAQYAIPEQMDLCPWDNDPVILAVYTSFDTARYATSNSFANEPIITLIKNTGSNELTNFNILYSINGDTPVQETFTGTLAPGASIDYEFDQKADLASAGNYAVDAWVELEEDNHSYNNSLEGYQVYHIPNNPISLPFTQYFEGNGEMVITKSKMGLGNADRWDFITPYNNGEMAWEAGTMKLTPTQMNNPLAMDNHAVVTLDLSNYTNDALAVGLSFQYRTLESIAAPNQVFEYPNTVSMRGSDMEEWIEVAVLGNDMEDWMSINNINLSNILEAEGQQFGTSAQIRFSQHNGTTIAIDNIRLSEIEALPVRLTDVSVDQLGGDVQLVWGTMKELNNEYFEIQMAVNGEGNQNEFQTIGTVNGFGTTTQPHNYHFLDTQPGKKGNRYYRLRQVNTDGTYSFSPVVGLEIENLEISKAFPNPFNNRVSLQYYSAEEQEVELVLTDNQGRNIESKSITAVKGKQFVSLDTSDDLTPGIYFLRVVDGQKTRTHLLVKE